MSDGERGICRMQFREECTGREEEASYRGEIAV